MKPAKIRIETDGIGLVYILRGLSEVNNAVADELPEELNLPLSENEIESLTVRALAFERINKLKLSCIQALRVIGSDAKDLDELEDNAISNLHNVKTLLAELGSGEVQNPQS